MEIRKAIYTLALAVTVITQAQERKMIIGKVAATQSSYDELMPVFSHDGHKMFFVRGGHPENDGGELAGQDIWYSELKEDSTWDSPKRFDQPLNNAQDNSVCGISKDGNTLYLDNIYDSRKRMHPGLSMARKSESGEWGKPQAVLVEDFTPKPPFLEFSFPESHTNIMLISAEHEDTSRKEDLYFSREISKGKWSTPVHMGDVINSKGYEIAPFLAKDGKTLYFASNGMGGEGHCDIFKSTRLDNSWTKWSTPENIGPEINTDGFDAYYTEDPLGRAYFVSGSLSDGDDDIYMIDYEVIEPEPVIEEVVEVIPEASIPDPEPFVPEFDKKFSVYFDLAKSDIKPEANKTVVNVLEALEQDESRMVTVIGHTCDRGSKGYNQKLSENRTSVVVDFLITKGVDPARIKSFAEGMFKPKVDNNTEANRELNRRAEIHVYE